MTTWFDPLKAAEVAHFFCKREGGEIPVLKLVKLIYLSDREHMSRFGYPVLNDRFVSMPHGPVNSITYNYIGGNERSEIWSSYITDRANYLVGTVSDKSEDDLESLSDAEIESLSKVWGKFGQMSRWELVDWTHENCPEWEDPNGSSEGIPHERVLKFLGISKPEEMAAAIKVQRKVDELFAKLAG